MFDSIFIFKLVLTFLVGSLWITVATLLAEKFGPKIGGVIGGMPSTIVIALFFIGWTQTPVVAATSTVLVPLVMGISALFILIYVYLSRFHIAFAIISALVIWFVLALGLTLLPFQNFAVSLLCFALLLSGSYWIMEYVWKVPSLRGKRAPFSLSNIIFRGVVSGSIITIAVALAKLGGPLIGGVFAAFPGVFLATMIITYSTQGRAFSVSVLKVLLVSGTINATVYASAVRFLYPLFGLIWGTISSFLISLISLYLVLLLTKKMA